MAMLYNEIPDLNRGAEYNQNMKEDNYPTKHYTNFTQIPRGVKEKLNLPIKNSTYLKNMITKKSQQSNQSGSKQNPKFNYNSNVFPLYNTNPDNFKRSISINDYKKAFENEGLVDGNNNDNYKLEASYDNRNNNNITNNLYNSTPSKKGNSTKNFLGNSFNNYNNSKINNSKLNNNFNNNSRSKSNGRSNKKLYNPMMNLIRTFTAKSLTKENPATYRKYRAQTKSTDKLYQNTTKYPVHINQNDSTVADYTCNNTSDAFNRVNASKGDPYPINDVNVNLSKYNDYEYYHNLSLHPLNDNNKNNYNSNKILNKNNNNNNNFNNNIYNYNSNNGFPNRAGNKKENSNPKMKKSFDVLSDILDSHFTINSPSNPKINLAAAAAENDMRNGDSKLNQSAFNNNINNNKIDNLNSPNFNYIENNNLNNNNNLNQNLNMSLNKENFSGRDFYKDKIYQQNEEAQNTKLTINLSYLGENPPERYLEALEHIMTILDPIFDRLSLTQKLEKFIENTEDHRRTIRLGSLVGIFVMLKKFQIEDEFKILILEKVVSLLHNYEIQEELFLVACLEIAGLFAPCDLLLENISLISMFLTDFNFPKLQKAAFNCLMLMEYDGLKALVDLASKDFKDYTRYILHNLINTPHIQKSVIVRALINEIYSNHPDKRHAALAALNRMHDLVAEDDILNKLSYFFKDPKIEKIFLASTLRTAGDKGEKILLKELKTNNEFSVRVAIASVLAYRTTKHPNYLEIRLDRNDTSSIAKTLPGSFCTYYGKISPYVYERILSEQDLINSEDIANLPYEEYLQVNSRDFLAALQRLISINYNHSNPKLVHRGNYNYLDDLEVSQGKSDTFAKYIEFFKIEKADSNLNEDININNQSKSKNFNLNNTTNKKDFSQSKTSLYNNNNNNSNNPNNNIFSDLVESSKNLISEDAIRGLCFCLKDYSSAVRECAANSLAHIALPEALGAVGNLIEALSDGDVVVRSKVVAAIGKIAAGCENAVIPHVVEALKTNFWKVKLACMNTLAEFGARAAKAALPYLHKLLRESAINKQQIADTIVRLGYEGESVLLKILTTEDDAQYKLKSVTTKALSLSAISGPNIDFIVETLFKASNSDNALIRLNALMAIKALADRADEAITYLKRKNVIPFYYNKLTDKDLAIQSYAIEAIKQLGPQGELIFIEGLSKDSNPIIRANCAIGLAKIGPHTIRTLLIGLHDENREVRKIVEKEITNKFAVYEILELFSEKNSQKLSLKIAIRDILEKCDSLLPATRNYFNDIIKNLDRDIYKTNYHVDVEANKNFKKEVDQYMDTYGNEGLEEDNVNKNVYNNFTCGEYQNPELKGSKNANLNNNNSFNRSYQRKL